MYQGDTGAPQMSAWPSYAPRLGHSFRNPIFASIFPNLNTRYLTDLTNLPVGYGGLPPVLQQNAGLSQLAGSTTAPAEDPLYGEIDRRDAPLSETTQTGGVVRQARDWFEYWQLIEQGIEVREPTAAARAAGADYMATTSPTTGNGSMDLGQLITDLGGQYIQSRWGQPQPTTGYYQQPIQATPALGPAVGAGIGLAAGELYDYFMNEDGTMSSRKKCKKRRRRKRLATVSDIADLAALKSILGNGDAFKTWIATHSR
jgi:hypothetical protein